MVVVMMCVGVHKERVKCPQYKHFNCMSFLSYVLRKHTTLPSVRITLKSRTHTCTGLDKGSHTEEQRAHAQPLPLSILQSKEGA